MVDRWLGRGRAHKVDAQEETAAGSIRLAIACSADAAIQDEVAAALSHEGRVEVLDRTEIDLYLHEGSLGALSQDATRRTRLGRLLALDYFVNLRRVADGDASPWVIEAVNAQTGALAGSVTVPAAPGPELERAAARFVQGTLLGKPVVKPDGIGSRRIAVLDFLLAEDIRNVDEAAVGLRLSAEVRRDLDRLGDVLVLDRTLCQQVAREHQSLNTGLAVPPDARLPMLGADCLVSGEVRHAPGGGALELALTVLDTREGRPLGSQGFPPSQRRRRAAARRRTGMARAPAAHRARRHEAHLSILDPGGGSGALLPRDHAVPGGPLP